MNITDNEEKIALVEALVVKGEVSFRDALKLLNEPYQVSIPSIWPNPQPWEITCTDGGLKYDLITTGGGGGVMGKNGGGKYDFEGL